MTGTNAASTNRTACSDLETAHHESVMLWGLTRAQNASMDVREMEGAYALADAIEKQSRRLADTLEALEDGPAQKTKGFEAAA